MRAPKKRRPSVNIMPMMTSVGTRLLTEARKMTAARAMRERKARRYLRSRIRARRPLSWAVVVIVVMRDCRRVFFLMVWVVREEEKEEVWTWEVVPRVSEFGSERKRGDKDVAQNLSIKMQQRIHNNIHVQREHQYLSLTISRKKEQGKIHKLQADRKRRNA